MFAAIRPGLTEPKGHFRSVFAVFEKTKREGQKIEEGKPFYIYGIYDCHTGETEP
jgi:hypothetical protein